MAKKTKLIQFAKQTGQLKLPYIFATNRALNLGPVSRYRRRFQQNQLTSLFNSTIGNNIYHPEGHYVSSRSTVSSTQRLIWNAGYTTPYTAFTDLSGGHPKYVMGDIIADTVPLIVDRANKVKQKNFMLEVLFNDSDYESEPVLVGQQGRPKYQIDLPYQNDRILTVANHGEKIGMDGAVFVFFFEYSGNDQMIKLFNNVPRF